jgi:hypothetical protein
MSGMFYLLNYKPFIFLKNKMRNIGFGQFLVLLLLCFLLFGDFAGLKKKLIDFTKLTISFFSKNSRKKGN